MTMCHFCIYGRKWREENVRNDALKTSRQTEKRSREENEEGKREGDELFISVSKQC